MDELVSLGKILSDKNRVKIILLLQREKELCVCEICDTLILSQPLVSRHLKQMREAGFVQTRKNGRWILYSLTQKEILFSLLKSIDSNTIELAQLICCQKREC